MKHFDAIIIGTGQAGPSLAVRFAGAGSSRHHRTPQVRRDLCEHGIPSDFELNFGRYLPALGRADDNDTDTQPD